MKWNRDSDNFNPSRSLVLIIREAGWEVYAPWNLELYTCHEAESYTIDAPWKKMLIDDIILMRLMYILQIWKSFPDPIKNWKIISSMNFFCLEDLLIKVSRWYHLLIPRYIIGFIFP